jgi:AcrR family transcriptional regulator
MRMKQEWYTVKEVEKELNVSRPTLYRYIENHGHYLKTNKVDNAIFISHQSLDILREIREQYENGKRKKQIEEYLKNKAVPLHITVRDNNVRMQESQGISEINEIKSLLETSTKFIVHTMNEHLEKQREEHHDNMMRLQETHEKTVQYLVKEIHDSREEIQILKDELVFRENKRDQQLMLLIRDMQETKKVMATTQEKKWWRFWER